MWRGECSPNALPDKLFRLLPRLLPAGPYHTRAMEHGAVFYGRHLPGASEGYLQLSNLYAIAGKYQFLSILIAPACTILSIGCIGCQA